MEANFKEIGRGLEVWNKFLRRLAEDSKFAKTVSRKKLTIGNTMCDLCAHGQQYDCKLYFIRLCEVRGWADRFGYDPFRGGFPQMVCVGS